MPTLHPLPSTVRPQSQADLAHWHLRSLVCPDSPVSDGAVTFELTPELQHQLESEFFQSPLPTVLLAATDWHIEAETTPGWEITRINGHVLNVLAGSQGQRGPAPVGIGDEDVLLDADADLDWLADWPEIRHLNVFHSPTQLDFLRHLPQLESLTLGDISYIEDFTPLAQLTRLKELAVGNGESPELAAGERLLDKLRAQVPHLPELDLSLWME